MRTQIFLTAFTVSLLAVPAQASDIDVAGLWLTADGSAHVDIADCGDGTPCGTVVWIDPAQGGGGFDDNNPDPELNGQSIVGSKMLWGFKPKNEKWGSGKIYDARDGKTYKSKLSLTKDDTLNVKGCVGPFCKTLVWTRVSPQ